MALEGGWMVENVEKEMGVLKGGCSGALRWECGFRGGMAALLFSCVFFVMDESRHSH